MDTGENIKTVGQIKIINNDLMESIYAEIVNRDGHKMHEKIIECTQDIFPPMIFEAATYNIYKEYMAMTRFIKKRGFKNNYEKGRYKVLKFMLNCIIADPINGDYCNEENNELLKEAGRLLDTGGDMHDNLVWAFVPKRFVRDIDVMWNGIGSWES